MVHLKDLKFAGKYDNYLKYFLFVLIAVQGLAIFLLNMFQTETYLFFDNAVAIRHGVEMWRNGLFLDNYNYFSTMEIDNAGFFAVPLYFLTGNWGLSLGIIHTLLYTACVYLIYSIFKNGGYDIKYGLCAVFLLFTPYVVGGLDWANMLFVTVGQYEFRIMVMLSVINLLLIALNKTASRIKFIILLSINALLCFWTSLSCGNYVILMILLPLILFFIYLNCITEKLEISKAALLVLGSSVLSGAIGLFLRTAQIGETSRGTLPLLTADTFSANLLNCITGFFMLFGGLTQEPYTPIFTFKGVLRIIKFILTCVCLVLVLKKLRKCKKNDYLPCMFVFVALVNLAVMILCVTRYGAVIYEYRYHIIWGALLLIVAAASFDSIVHARLKNMVFLGVLFMAIMINVGGFNGIFQKTTATDFEREIISFADENNLDTIYLYDMSSQAATIRVLDIDKSCMSVVYVDGKVYPKTDNFYEDYSTHYDYDDKHLFVCTPESFELLPDEIKNCYSDEIVLDAGYVYIGSKNPWLN